MAAVIEIPRSKAVLDGDSSLLLGLACLPTMIGVVVNWIYESPLGERAKEEESVPRLIEIIDLKNKYKIASIISMTVNCFACEYFGLLSPVICAGILFGFVWLQVSDIVHNKNLVVQLESRGLASLPLLRSQVC